MKDCQIRSNKPVVLATSVETTAAGAERLPTVTNGVSYRSDSRWSQQKKFKGLRFEEHGSQIIFPPRSIHLPGFVAFVIRVIQWSSNFFHSQNP
ncbi:hypothetical protein TNCV_4812871 [Trichonephila clavipes]|nr:hypothetical protein TNCV_4812871 [Trichonephila clavipes]